MSNQPKEKDANHNPPNILIELSDNREKLYEDKNFNDNIKEQHEDIEDENNHVEIFSQNPILYENDLKSQTFSEKIKKNYLTKMNLFFLILNISGILFYNYSLMTCESDATICTLKQGLFFYVRIGILVLLSAICFSIITSIAFYYNKYYFHFLYTMPPYLYFIKNYTGTNTLDHGLYNSLGWIIFNFLLISIILIILKMYHLIKYKNYKTTLFIIISIILVIIYFNTLPGFSCDFWSYGLNNTKIDNDKNRYACELMIPGKNKCYLKKMDGIFDFSRIFRPSCTAESVIGIEKQRFLNSLDDKFFGVSKLNHFGYPITTLEKFDMLKTSSLKEYQELINHNTIKMDLYNEKNYPGFPYPEVEVFFDENNHGRVKINLTRNETLSSERKEVAKDKNSIFNNVFILYIDSISRNLFRRKFHKLAKLIEQYMPYNRNEKEKPFNSFQFLKFNTFMGLTFPNIKAMFYGVDLDNPNGVNVLKYYKQQGFVTGHTGTTCAREIYSVVNAIVDMGKDLDYDVWDHENIALFCDPNFFDSTFLLYRGVQSYLKRCLYGKYGFEYTMEYSKQFWNAYPDNKKFYRIHLNEPHEGSTELLIYLADPIYEFVKYFFDNNLFKDTFLLVLSDHGSHLIGPFTFIRPQDYVLEETLPALFFIMPNNEKLYENGMYDEILKNQQVYLSPYDIHDTLIQLPFEYEKVDPNLFSKKGSSILSYINPMERYCENPDFDIKISPQFCRCKKYKR